MKKLMLFTLVLALLASPFARAETDAEKIARLEGELARALQTIDELREQLKPYQDSAIVASFDGGCVLFEDVFREYEAMMEVYQLFYGDDLSEDPEEAARVQREIATELARKAIIEARLSADNAQLLTDEETQRALDEAARAYAQLVDENAAYYLTEGNTDEAANASAQAFLAEIGSDPDALAEMYLEEARNNALVKYMAGEVTVTEEYLSETYQALLAADEAYYGVNPGEYAYEALYGSALITWIPEGYRRVRALLVPFDAETQALADELAFQLEEASAAEAPAIQAKIDELYAFLAPKANEVTERLKAGETFGALMQEFPADGNLLGGSGKEDGFAISEDALYFSEDLARAAVEIAKIGDTSAPVRADAGWMILEYAGDVTPGAVPLEDIRERLLEIAEETKMYEQYEETAEKWVREANLTYFMERIN